MATNGRGAWTKTGKDNGSVYYENITGKPTDGSTPDKGVAYQAVTLGVKAIQNRLNKLGYTPALTVDGNLGAKSSAAIKWFQANNGGTADGKAGMNTCRLLWRSLIADATKDSGVDPRYIFGQLMHESSGDPAACGYYHEPDRGLVQINTESENVGLDQAHDPYFAIPWSVKRFKSALDKYAGKGSKIQIACSILQHNSPAGADTYFRTGTFGTKAAEDYVTAVLNEAAGWDQ